MGFKSWRKLHKEGVLLNSFYQQLTKKRMEINPYYLVREGIFDLEKEPISTKLSPCETVMLGPSDFRILAARKERDQSEEEMLHMLKSGDKYCMGIKHKGEIVAYGWYELRFIHTKYMKLPLKNNEAYLSGARTFGEYRGNNLAPYLRYQMYLYLKEKGYTTLYSVTEFGNVSSLRFKKKLGAYPVKLYLYFVMTKYFRKTFLLRTYRDKFPEKD